MSKRCQHMNKMMPGHVIRPCGSFKIVVGQDYCLMHLNKQAKDAARMAGDPKWRKVKWVAQPEAIPATTTALAVLPKSDALAQLDKARQMLAESRTLPEVKKIRNMAEAARVYAKAANLGHEAQNFAAEIALLAARKAGEILKQLDKSKGGRPDKTAATVAAVSEYAQTLKDTGTKERTARQWQQLAAIPQPSFEKYVSSTKEKQQEITAAGLLKSVPLPAPSVPAKSKALSQAEDRAEELQKFARQHFAEDASVVVCRKQTGLPPFLFNLDINELEEEDIRAAVIAASNSRSRRAAGK